MSEAPRHAQRIPVTLVTGFLGSGKTTLINAGLKAPDLSKTVVVVNEFGEVGLDHELFTSSNDAVIVLENGCLCCTVKSDLIGTLNSLFHDRNARRLPDFNNVVIETTGLAEPGPVIQAFLSEPTLDGIYRVANVVTVVDAVNWESTANQYDEAVRQVALADTILVSKLDLAEEDSFETLSADLRGINPAASIQKISFASEFVAPLLMHPGFDAANPGGDPTAWLAIASYETYGKPGNDADGVRDQLVPDHLSAKGIESFVLTRSTPLLRDELQFLLDGIAQNLGSSLLRVKGLINIREEQGKPAVVQGAQHLLHNLTWLDKWPSADERTRIIFITQGIAREKLKEIIELLDRMSERTFAAREKARLARLAVEQRAT